MTRAEILAVLRATPDGLAALGRGLAPGVLHRRAAEGEWSMADVVDHLVRGERDVILPRFRRMLAEAAPVFASSLDSRTGFAAPPDPSGWAADLVEFRRTRQATLTFLDGLADSDWQRTGTTPTRGTLTLEAYARYLAGHDREHLAQLRAVRAAGPPSRLT